MNNCNINILFITDIHQNLTLLKKIDLSLYDYILCAGDIINASEPDIILSKKIIDLLPEETIIIPGNCDNRPELIDYMKKKLKYINKSSIYIDEIPVIGVGFCRHINLDIPVYREFFLQDKSRILHFYNNNKMHFLLKFCGIIIENNNIKVLPEEEAVEISNDFLNKFTFFDEKKINRFFDETNASGGIILTHSPPYGVLDQLIGLPHIGSQSILKGIKKIKPDIVLCGHFHELWGTSKIDNSIIFNPGAVNDGRYGEIKIIDGKIDTIFKTI